MVHSHVFFFLTSEHEGVRYGLSVLFKNALTRFVEAKTILLKYYHDLLEVNQQITPTAPQGHSTKCVFRIHGAL